MIKSNRKTLLFVLLFVFISSLYASLTWASASTPLNSDEQEAKKAVQNYINGIKNHDVEEILEWVVDTRFRSEVEQRKKYQELFEHSSIGISKTKIERIEKVDENTMNVLLELSRKGSGKIHIIELPVIKSDNKWRLLITGLGVKE
ncbi:MAG: hypothetical protein WDZ91_03420 [Paenibacillaceae bacterium]